MNDEATEMIVRPAPLWVYIVAPLLAILSLAAMQFIGSTVVQVFGFKNLGWFWPLIQFILGLSVLFFEAAYLTSCFPLTPPYVWALDINALPLAWGCVILVRQIISGYVWFEVILIVGMTVIVLAVTLLGSIIQQYRIEHQVKEGRIKMTILPR